MRFGIRETVFVMLLMAIPLAAWWFVFRPNNMRNDEMKAQIAIKQDKLSRVRREEIRVGDLKAENASLTEALNSIESKLPSEKEIDKVLREVWKLAETNKMVTKSVRAIHDNRVSGVGPHAEQTIEMKLDGDFMGLYAFLQSMENLDRIMRVNSMKIRAIDKEAAGTVHAELVLSIFFDKSAEG